jgi:hypothetical protein
VPEHGETPITDAELEELERLVADASPAPWRAYIEGRDNESGDSFIAIGDPREADMDISRDDGRAPDADWDFIAAARNYMPRLLSEIRRLRRQS